MKSHPTNQPKANSTQNSVTLGGQTYDENALLHNLIAFGAIGSGKSAAVVYPVLEQICALYNNESSQSPHAKFGGLIFDIKGDFHEALIYTMQASGRDLLKDLVVIRPDNDYCIVEFEDIATHRRFFVTASGATDWNECDQVLKQATGPNTVLQIAADNTRYIKMANGDLERLNSNRLSYRYGVSPELSKALSQLTFDVTGQPIKWLSWREEEGKLVKITNTINKLVQYAVNELGQRITTMPPTKLRYIRNITINNGITYNLLAQTSSSQELVAQLTDVAYKNYNATAKWKTLLHTHLTSCIDLKRQLDGECSLTDLRTITGNEDHLVNYVYLGHQLERLKAKLQNPDLNPTLRQTLEDAHNYFSNNWYNLDPKTKSTITDAVCSLVSDILRNEQLTQVFCQPSTISFADCQDTGKVYTLVLSSYPNAQMLVGALMKHEFQQTTLRYNGACPRRFLLFMADEYQFFLTNAEEGSNFGDAKFLREARVCNFVCTQAVSSLMAVQSNKTEVNTFLDCFGGQIFLQNLDDCTNQHAAALFEKEYYRLNQHKQTQKIEASCFPQMNPFDAVLFNQANSHGDKIHHANLKQEAKFWDRNKLAEAANTYYRSYLENLAVEQGRTNLFDTQSH